MHRRNPAEESWPEFLERHARAWANQAGYSDAADYGRWYRLTFSGGKSADALSHCTAYDLYLDDK